MCWSFKLRESERISESGILEREREVVVGGLSVVGSVKERGGHGVGVKQQCFIKKREGGMLYVMAMEKIWNLFYYK